MARYSAEQVAQIEHAVEQGWVTTNPGFEDFPAVVPWSPQEDADFNAAWLDAPVNPEGDAYIVEGWDGRPDVVYEEELEFAPPAMPLVEVGRFGVNHQIPLDRHVGWMTQTEDGQHMTLSAEQITALPQPGETGIVVFQAA